MNCQYCFYYDVMNHRELKNYGFMSEETLEQIVKRAFEYADQSVTFAFQGGEPTLIGLEFYEKLIQYVKKYNVNKIKTDFSLQTNGLKVDQGWADFFKKHNFLIGLSLDGPKETHDRNRLDPLRKGTFLRVNKTGQLLIKTGVDVNVLCVVSKSIARHPAAVYRFFKKNNYKFMQFIPCLDALGEKPGINDYSLNPEDYGDFLCDLFDLWYQDLKNGTQISIRMFDNIVQMFLGYPPESCDLVGHCSINAVIEGDGKVYPCDFYVLDEWCLGNININSFDELKEHSNGKQFVESSRKEEPECQSCKFYSICRTGCRRHKEPVINGKLSKNYFCSAYQNFYNYTMTRFIEIANQFRTN